MLETTISNNQMAINRLEYEAQRCLKELTNQQSSQINLPYLLNGKHIEFMVTREEVRQLQS